MYCKTHFCHILISKFSFVESSLHFKLADFSVNFIKQIVSYFMWCLYQMLLLKLLSYYCIHYMFRRKRRILHIISRKCWYSMQINLWWWDIPKIRVYLISRFYSNRKNLVLTEYICLTVRHTGQINLGVDDCLLLAILKFVIKNFTFKPH